MRALALGHPALDASLDGASAAALRAIGALVRAPLEHRALVAMLTKLCR